MRPVLIVGCGGSGGVTLQFLMDQLKADLSMKGVHTLPAAWQFVHVDVPLQPDGTAPSLPPVVPEQGPTGRYVGLASRGGDFDGVTHAVGTRLIEARRLTQLATWLVDPGRNNFTIVTGAGQARAVGRVVTLSALSKAKAGLQAAVTAMNAAGARTELAQIAQLVSPGSEVESSAAPVVFVVSSMAGGAGASMVLDVCRLLSQEPGLAPGLTGLFLFTPEVFDSLDKRGGVPGNALFMTGELVATQLGAATADDLDLLKALGVGGIEGAGVGATFGRVVPIGAKIGLSGPLFADGNLHGIYRGVGRGLAALLLSGQALNEWVAYDLTNKDGRPGDAEHFGWSASAEDVQWGSFGFAQLSTGRDRYGEYAAQRVAREAVVRLVSGHRNAGAPGTDLEQLARLVHERLPYFAADLGLPGGDPINQWFLRLIGQVPSDRAAAAVGQHLDRVLAITAEVDAQQWLGYVQTAAQQARPAIAADLEASAYEWVHGWYVTLLDRTQQVLAELIATDGLPAARDVLDRIAKDADGWAAALRDLARVTVQDPLAVDSGALGRVQTIRGKIGSQHAAVLSMREAYAASFARAFAGIAGAKLAEVLGAMRTEFLSPLSQACSEGVAVLRAAVDADIRGGGLAQLRTNEFAEWPEGGQAVPARFTHAQNEVLLIDKGEFARQFDDHLIETLRTERDPSPNVAASLSATVRQVILNVWPTVGAPPTGDLVVREVDCRPAALHRDPGKAERVPSRHGRYRIAISPAEVLDRARGWIQRPSLPFNNYVTTSLREFVSGSEVPESVRADRTNELKVKFRNTLQLARPLIAVNQSLVTALHHSTEAQVLYKFSEVPMDGLGIAEDLRGDLRAGDVEPRSLDAFNSSLKSLSDATRIDVFGSFAPLSPLAFSSLLGPLAEGWASAQMPAQREKFYGHRRSRRLPGAVAMSDAHRRAVIGGWYVARYTGRLRLPGESHAQDDVQVYDEQSRRWVSFPHPLVVPPAELNRSINNYLPAVLLSFGLAMAQVGGTGSLAPLLPYTVLRRRWDDTTSGLRPSEPRSKLAAARNLDGWLRGEPTPEGAPAAHAEPGADDPEKARLVLLDKVQKVRATIGADYLRPNQDGATGGGSYSVVDRLEDVHAVPLFHEVAPDVHHALGVIAEILAAPVAAETELI